MRVEFEFFTEGGTKQDLSDLEITDIVVIEKAKGKRYFYVSDPLIPNGRDSYISSLTEMKEKA